MQPLAIYIHWPFCKKKCPYCDFNSHVREQVDFDAWQNALLTELRYWHGLAAPARVRSIFFGGGTPSLMPPNIAAALIEEVHRLWPTDEALEITLEANPTSVESEKFADLARAGVNRFSLGIQSLRSESLAFLGREHSVNEALCALELAAKHATRYSFDLIYALPHQTPEAWEKELRGALALGAQHMSLYQLTIEENTAFHHAYYTDKAFHLPNDTQSAELYERTQSIMREAGLPAYEISNHAVRGQESLHNLAYWRGHAYLGIGAGAHGRVDTPSSRMATHNIKSPERWLSSVQKQGYGLEDSHALSLLERQEEKLLMGLRLTHEGVSLDAPTTAILQARINLLKEHALVTFDDNTHALKVTDKGALVLNAITAELTAALH